MKFRTIIFSMMLTAGLFVNQARAWTNEDSAYETAYLMTHVADWGQTRDIAAQCNGGRYYETNLILGTCPSMNAVNTYFVSTAVLHITAAYLLPSPYRRIFQTGTIGMQLGFVNNNANIGLNIRF